MQYLTHPAVSAVFYLTLAAMLIIPLVIAITMPGPDILRRLRAVPRPLRLLLVIPALAQLFVLSLAIGDLGQKIVDMSGYADHRQVVLSARMMACLIAGLILAAFLRLLVQVTIRTEAMTRKRLEQAHARITELSIAHFEATLAVERMRGERDEVLLIASPARIYEHFYLRNIPAPYLTSEECERPLSQDMQPAHDAPEQEHKTWAELQKNLSEISATARQMKLDMALACRERGILDGKARTEAHYQAERQLATNQGAKIAQPPQAAIEHSGVPG